MNGSSRKMNNESVVHMFLLIERRIGLHKLLIFEERLKFPLVERLKLVERPLVVPETALPMADKSKLFIFLKGNVILRYNR